MIKPALVARPKPATPKAPPPLLLSAVSALRGTLERLHRATAPSSVAVLELGFGAWQTQALYAAVRLGIVDALKSGPLTAEAVAAETGTHPGATYRLMRALAGRSVLKLRRDGQFTLTRTGRALLSDDPNSMAPMLTFIGSTAHWEHWGSLEHSVRTGATAVSKLRGREFFDYLDTDAEFARIFNDAMTGISAVAIENAVPTYDFSGLQRIVDVGGGHGALLAAVLRQTPEARGVLFDLPSVVSDADVDAQRGDVEGGSFFDAVPRGDGYLLKTVIHDWDDDQALQILKNIRAAVSPTGKVLLFEMVLPEGAPAHLGLLLDLEMLVSAGGRERTRREYSELLARAGFKLTRVLPTPTPLSIIEAVPV